MQEIKGYALEDEVDALVVPEVAVHAQDVLVPVRVVSIYCFMEARV